MGIREGVVVSTCMQRSSAAIRGHQRPSEAIRGHQRPSEAIRGHQTHRPSTSAILDVIRGHQRPSDAPPLDERDPRRVLAARAAKVHRLHVWAHARRPDHIASHLMMEAINADQQPSAAISGPQRSSEVISGHQRPSAVISGHQRSSAVITLTSRPILSLRRSQMGVASRLCEPLRS